MIYLIFKWLHILAAITALGSNITYGFWLSRAARSPQTLVFTLQTIRALDNQLANRGYGLLLVTGILMVFLGHWPLTTSWLITALGLYVVVGLIGAFAFAPNLRRQIQLAEAEGLASPDYQAAARRSTLYGIATILVVVIIVLLMVTKPHLWG